MKDLGVLVSSPYSFKNHIANNVRTSYRRVFSSNDNGALVLVFKGYVRLLLEFASILWCPHQKYDGISYHELYKNDYNTVA